MKKKQGGWREREKNHGERGNEATVVREWHMSGDVNGTQDISHNHSCSACFTTLNRILVCKNTEVTLNSIGPHIASLSHTYIVDIYHTKPCLCTALLWRKIMVPIAMALCNSVFSNVPPCDEQTQHQTTTGFSRQ